MRPFPGPGGKWRISTSGGAFPRWPIPTHELLFINPYDPAPAKTMTVPYAVAGDAFRAETPRPWSPTSVQGVGVNNTGYDLHPDGKRMAVSAVTDQGRVTQDHVVFILNFADYLSKIASGKK